MTRYLLRRTGLLILTGSAALVAIFVLLRLLPGDPANALLSGTATPEQIEAARRQVGSDLPWWSQFGQWASSLLRGDLGTSFTSGLSVNDQIASRMAVTLPLTLAAFGISLIVAIVLGYVAARARRSWAGTVISALAQLGIAVPVFWIGMLLVLAFAVDLHWLPASGFPARGWTNAAQAVRALILPTLTIVLVSTASLTRYTRSAALDVLDAPFLQFARSLGESRGEAMVRHGLRVASIPVISIAGIELATTFIGAVVVEQVFALPGLGSMLTTAIAQHDYPSIQGVLLVSIIVLFLQLRPAGAQSSRFPHAPRFRDEAGVACALDRAFWDRRVCRRQAPGSRRAASTLVAARSSRRRASRSRRVRARVMSA